MLRGFASQEDAPLLHVSTYEAGDVVGCVPGSWLVLFTSQSDIQTHRPALQSQGLVKHEQVARP